MMPFTAGRESIRSGRSLGSALKAQTLDGARLDTWDSIGSHLCIS
jgi:hypothetical protein